MLPEDDENILDDEWKDEVELVNRFTECVIQKNENIFFDSDDLLVIIEHFIQDENSDYAQQAINYAYRFFPNDTDFIVKNAKVAMMEGKLDKAFDLLDEAKTGNDNVEYKFTLAQYYALRNQHDKAIDTYCEALSLADSPYDKSNLNYGLASQYMTTQQYKKALFHLKESLVNADPANRDIIFLDIRHCYQYDNRLDEAIQYFNAFIDKEPSCLAAWNSLADCYRKQERYDEASEHYEYALSINPADYYANINLANTYYLNEQYTQAIETMNEALVNGMTETSEVNTLIADSFYSLDKNTEAENHYRRALGFDPEDTNAWSGLGFIYSDAQNYTKAIQYLLNGISNIHDDNCLEVLLTLASAYDKTNDKTNAIKTYNYVIEHWPEDPSAYCMLAQIHIDKKEFPEALDTLENGLVKTNYDSCVEYYMAYFMLRTNNREDGFYFLSQALQDDYDSSPDFIDLDPNFLGNDTEVLELIDKYKRQSQE